jgi:hypothetical protein
MLHLHVIKMNKGQNHDASNAVLRWSRGHEGTNVVDQRDIRMRILNDIWRDAEDDTKNSTTSSGSNKNNSTASVPSFEGFLTLEFSLFFAEYANEAYALSQHNVNVVEADLDSLLHFFLCSRDIELVVSRKPNELTSVCPFQGNVFDSEDSQDDGVRRHLGSFFQGIADQWRRILADESDSNNALSVDIDDPTSMVLWNIPEIEHEILMLGGKRIKVKGTVGDDPDEYFTRWKFTYPVYNWGPFVEHEDAYDEERLQLLLDGSIESGTFGSALPWKDAEVSIVGDELLTFAGATISDDDAFLNNSSHEISHSTAEILRVLGSLLLIFNTMFVVLMTILAKRHRLKKEKEAEDARANLVDANDSRVLGTEEGVSEMLMESKKFAIEKSQEFRTSSTHPQKRSDHAVPLFLSSSLNSSRKEVELMNEAAGHKKEYRGRLLVNLSMEEEEREDGVDVKPQSLVRRQRSSRSR